MIAAGPLRVCLLGANDPDYVESLALSLAEESVQLDLIGSAAFRPKRERATIRFHQLDDARRIGGPRRAKLRALVRYYLCLWRLLRAVDPEIVHLQDLRFPPLDALLVGALARRGVAVVYTAHNVQSKRWRGSLARAVYAHLYRRFSYVLCHTQSQVEALARRFPATAGKTAVVGRALNGRVPRSTLTEREARDRLGLDPEATVLLIFGRTRADKGGETAIRALSLETGASACTLLVVGKAVGPVHEAHRRRLESLARELGLEHRVRVWDEHVPTEHVATYFEAADAALLPYEDDGFLSGVLFLAYWFGVPVVASDIAPLREVIPRCPGGRLFRTGDAKELARQLRAVRQTRQRAPERRAAERRRIRDVAAALYRWDDVAKRTFESYLEARRRSSAHRARR